MRHLNCRQSAGSKSGPLAAAALLAASIVMMPAASQATDRAKAANGGSPSPTASEQLARPGLEGHGFVVFPARPRFDRNDEAAALEAVHVALTEVGDGSSYVWYRHGGRLSGIVQPTQSFQDTRGRVCRHLMVTLSAGADSRRTGAIACRLADGSWTLDG